MDLNDTDVNLPEGSSSPDQTAPDVTPPSSSAPDVAASSSDADVSAPSSSADAPTEKQDLLSVVQGVLQPKEPPAAAPKPEATTTGDAGATPAPETDPAEVSPEELAKFSPAAQDRIRQLANTNRDLKRKLEGYAPALAEYEKIQTFMQANHLQNDHVGMLFQFGAALRRGDLAEAKAMMEPYWLTITEALGERLPEDVQRKVDDGLIADDEARELVRLRAERDRLSNTLRETSQEQSTQQIIQQRTAIQQATVDWETQVRSRDPDYSAKADAVLEFSKAIIAERGLPRTPQEAQAWSQEALDRVNKTFARFRPSPQPTRASPTGVHVSTPVSAEPKSLMEAVAIGLQRARAGS